MSSTLLHQPSYAPNQSKHLSNIFRFPNGEATLYVSTLFELGDSDLPHFHDEPHLAFILNGGLIDKRKTIEKERFSGELTFFRAGERHQTITRTFPTKYVSLQFQSDFFKQYSFLENRLENTLQDVLTAKFVMLKIYKEMRAADEFSTNSLQILLNGLISDEKIDDTKRPDWIGKIVELLHDKWNEEISLSDLSNVADVHPKTISKYFPKFFKCTLGEYRRKIKVEKSLSLIKTSKLTLTEIAYECGFYDQSHFTATFKNLTGFLPKQFQKL